MRRCKCGFESPSAIRFNAHLAWADALPTRTARMEHGTMAAPGASNGGQTGLWGF